MGSLQLWFYKAVRNYLSPPHEPIRKSDYVELLGRAYLKVTHTFRESGDWLCNKEDSCARLELLIIVRERGRTTLSSRIDLRLMEPKE